MAKVGRNDVCPCGSGRKFKKCCELKDRSAQRSRVGLFVVAAVVGGALIAAVVSFSTADAGSSTRVWDPVHGHYHDINGLEVP